MSKSDVPSNAGHLVFVQQTLDRFLLWCRAEPVNAEKLSLLVL